VTGSWAARDLHGAAAGMAAICRAADGDDDRDRLAYVAMYAGRFTGRGRGLDVYRACAQRLRDDDFVRSLFGAVSDTVEVHGWKVVGHDHDRILIEKDGMAAFVMANELTGGSGSDVVTFRSPVLRVGMLPGFVVRTGREALVDRALLSRLYVSVKAPAASWALGPLARRLDADGVPFEMKVIANTQSYLRHDACVVYVASSDEERAIGLVVEATSAAPGAVHARGPRLTGPVGTGVSLAHEPSDVSSEGISHGQWVASLFGQAARHSSVPPIIAARVRALIIEAGRDPSRPHLRAPAARGVA